MRRFKCNECGAIVESEYQIAGSYHNVVPSAKCSGYGTLAEVEDETTPLVSPTSDTERLVWCLRYALVRTLGINTDFEYIPLTLELIDRAIAKEKGQTP